MRLLTTLLIVCLAPIASAQQYWGKRQGGAGTDETTAITTDLQGNVYTVGYYSLSAPIGGVALQSSGLTDFFLQKTSPDGSILYTVHGGGSFSDRALGVAAHSDGSAFVCGYYTGSIQFGNGVNLTANAGSQDAFLVRYNADGVAQWAQSGGGATSADRANGVAVDSQGNVFITGQYAGTSSFDWQNISGSGNSGDIFIAKYSLQGNLLWVKVGVGPGNNRGLAIAADAEGACYITGQFSDNITFDQAFTNTIINALFIVKYNGDGTQGWFRRAGGSSQSIGYGIASEGSNVYVTGDCGPQLTFFNGPGFPVISNNYSSAVFLAAFSTTGNWLWGRSMGSNSAVSARAIAVRGGALALTGWFECTFDELSTNYGEGIFNNMGFRDVWVMRYDQTGDFIRSHHLASRFAATGNGIAIGQDLDDIVVGGFRSRLFTTDPNSGNQLNGMTHPNNYQGSGPAFCGDNAYAYILELFGSINSDNLDGFILKTLSPSRQPLDIYSRNLFADCDRSIPPGQISFFNQSALMPPPDTIAKCAPSTLRMTVGTWAISEFSYQFETQWNGPAPIENTFTSGIYSATSISADGCYTRADTVFAFLQPTVAKPNISDSFGVNVLTSSTQLINICPGDTVAIWGQFPDSLAHGWDGYGNGYAIINDTVYSWNSGYYSLFLENSYGCSNHTAVQVSMLPAPPDTLAPILELYWNGSVLNTEDTAFVCSQNLLYGRVKNGLTEQLLDNTFTYNWSVVPTATGGGSNPRSYNMNTSGYYTVTVQLSFSNNACFTADSIYTLSAGVWVEVTPVPQISFTTQVPPFWCPATPVAAPYQVQGNLQLPFGVQVLDGDSLLFPGPGNYPFQVNIPYGVGCNANSFINVNIQPWPVPVVQTLPASGLICPDDSVWIYSNANAILQWFGPFGESGDGSGIYASQPGPYFTTASYPNDCMLTSNSVEITGYATPYITAWPPALCLSGGSVTLTLVATHPDNITWFAPLTGDSTVQVITEPGVYGALVTACGYTSEVYITVGYSTEVISVDVLPGPYCEGDTASIQAAPGFTAYQWNTGATGEVLYVTESGTYVVAGDDPFGCTVLSQEVQVEFNPTPPAPEFSYTAPCIGDGFSVGVTPGYSTTWVAYGDTLTAVSWQTETLTETLLIEAWLSSPICSGEPAFVEITPKPRPQVPFGSSNSPVCTGSTVELLVEDVDDDFIYHWLSPLGGYAQGSSAAFNAPTPDWEGDYLLWASLNGCAGDTLSILVLMNLTAQVDLPADTIICENSGFSLQTNIPFSTYYWSTGSEEPSAEVEEAGMYWVYVTDGNGCPSYDETDLQLVNCKLIIPNVFTPNGDGQNDLWNPSTDLPSSYMVKLFNQWGKLVFESNSYFNGWDGTNNKTGEKCAEGAYFYVVEVTSYDQVQLKESGTVSLFR